jgi:hypothetical protein
MIASFVVAGLALGGLTTHGAAVFQAIEPAILASGYAICAAASIFV